MIEVPSQTFWLTQLLQLNANTPAAKQCPVTNDKYKSTKSGIEKNSDRQFLYYLIFFPETYRFDNSLFSRGTGNRVSQHLAVAMQKNAVAAIPPGHINTIRKRVSDLQRSGVVVSWVIALENTSETYENNGGGMAAFTGAITDYDE